MYGIDLREISTRESERTEWKDQVYDISDVIKSIVAFANDISNLGGGYVVCGAKEGKDEAGFQKIELTGLTSTRLREIEGKVLSDCREKVDPPIIPITDETPTADPDKRVLIFIVPASEQAHNYRRGREDSSKYYIRIGRETREARNGLLRELLVRKKVIEPWDRRINHEAKTDDIDLIILRDYLQQMGLWDPNKSLEDYLSEKDRLSSFVPPLAGKEKITNIIRFRNFTLLMFGKNPTNYFPGAYSVFSIYRGKDRSEPTAERIEVIGTIVEQAKRLIGLLNAESIIAFDKTHSHPNQVKYPMRALQEVVINALVHRDYETSQPNRITVFSDRIEINSSGNLHYAIDPETFKEGKASPYWRNQTLSYFFNKLQLAQGEGQGIPTIIRTMQEEGCPSPIFEIGTENLICILPAHPRHKLMRELNLIENAIILGNLKDALIKCEELIVEDRYNYRIIELYCEVNNLLKTPEKVYDLAQTLDLNKFNSSTILVIADSLISIKDNIDSVTLAKSLMDHAMTSILEENDIKKIAINYRKMKEDEKAIEFINNAITKIPKFSENSILLELRAKAKIDLAKKCIETAKNPNSSFRIKLKAWDRCRAYLSEAERDLIKALEHVLNETDKDYILRDIDFLKYLQQIAKKPPQKDFSKR